MVEALEQAAAEKVATGHAKVQPTAIVRRRGSMRLWRVSTVSKVGDGRVAEVREIDAATKKAALTECPVDELTLVRAALSPRERHDVLQKVLEDVDPEGPMADQAIDTTQQGRCPCGSRHPRMTSSIDRDRISSAMDQRVAGKKDGCVRLTQRQHEVLRLLNTRLLHFRKLADHISITKLAEENDWDASTIGEEAPALALLGVIDYLPGTGWVRGDVTGTLPAWVRIRVPQGWREDAQEGEDEGVPGRQGPPPP